jgi:predicted nucleic acid-binding protein
LRCGCSFRAATVWAEIPDKAKLRRHPQPVNDSWIAACCVARDRPLVTFNIKNYADFAGPGLVERHGALLRVLAEGLR